ncbi:TPA: hypothetical protein N0F65_002672 [Lagenidium giganteum]|uniref:Nudix hydrolase domain-containing protein n=1 Tax=Lagenidium giganteum TaxID=4803 RepID=A0AAV2Z6I4_9STRA|nr:TPA: hypothetical protein N0F65_002672 [Lagenidium giganteum]
MADTSPVRLVNAATLICLRCKTRTDSSSSSSPWEVLLGQSEVKNWLSSTATSTRIMRYPGEWKFPGGAVDANDGSFRDAALRELQEEFLGIPVTASNAQLYYFNTKVTRPVQQRRHRMVNFVAFAEENAAWMNDTAVEAVNETLASKRAKFQTLLSDGTYWAMSTAEKESVSPEIHRVRWFPLDQAFNMMAETMIDKPSYVDEWQRGEFTKYGIARRDPMYISMLILRDIGEFETLDDIKAFLATRTPPTLQEFQAQSHL